MSTSSHAQVNNNNGVDEEAITYESVLNYLEQVGPEITSSLDIKQHPLDEDTNNVTINDLQTYFDQLVSDLGVELKKLPLSAKEEEILFGQEDEIKDDDDDDIKNDDDLSISNNDGIDETDMPEHSNTPSGESILASTSSTSPPQSPLISPTLIRSCITASPSSVTSNPSATASFSQSQSQPSPSCSSSLPDNENDIESDKSNSHFESHLLIDSSFYPRASFYENNDEINIESMSAAQIKMMHDSHSSIHNIQSSSTLQFTKNSHKTSKSSSKTLLKSYSSTSLSPKSLFGCDIENIEKLYCGLSLPTFIESLIIYLSRNALDCAGIFRKSGVKSRIVLLKQLAEEGMDVNLEEFCFYDIADVTKMWLREIRPIPLITQHIVKAFKDKKKEYLKDYILNVYPEPQRAILQVVLRFLALFASKSELNQMNSHNLSICLTPSLCEYSDQGDKQIFDCQKCLEWMINHCETLFTVSLTSYSIPNSNGHDNNTNFNSNNTWPTKHEATSLIQGSPQDIMKRILYQRNLIDPTIVEWNIIDEMSESSDTFEISIQSSAFLPMKSMIIERSWRSSDMNNIEIKENGIECMFESRWSIISQGEGKTLVAHMLAQDIKGHAYDWYSKIFPSVHNLQLQRLAQSFLISNSKQMKSSDV